MQVEDTIRFLVDINPQSKRGISRALGRDPTWARNSVRLSHDPRLTTVARLADLIGADVALVDRATGATLATIDPPTERA